VILEHTDDSRSRQHIVESLSAVGDSALEHKSPSSAETLDPKDPNAVWRQLAALSSFGNYRDGEQKPNLSEQSFIPYQSNHGNGAPVGLLGPGVNGT
jgi:hypothetical protein